jgi:hypothetical protein
MLAEGLQALGGGRVRRSLRPGAAVLTALALLLTPGLAWAVVVNLQFQNKLANDVGMVRLGLSAQFGEHVTGDVIGTFNGNDWGLRMGLGYSF